MTHKGCKKMILAPIVKWIYRRFQLYSWFFPYQSRTLSEKYITVICNGNRAPEYRWLFAMEDRPLVCTWPTGSSSTDRPTTSEVSAETANSKEDRNGTHDDSRLPRYTTPLKTSLFDQWRCTNVFFLFHPSPFLHSTYTYTVLDVHLHRDSLLFSTSLIVFFLLRCNCHRCAQDELNIQLRVLCKIIKEKCGNCILYLFYQYLKLNR